jgi:tetratricopeptide (TPR) repeat protein
MSNAEEKEINHREALNREKEPHEPRFLYLRKKEWLVALFAAIITFLVFLPVLSNGFVNSDDDDYVYQSTAIRHVDGQFFKWIFQFHSSNWHPLTWVSHAIDYALWGLSPAGHHLSSIIFHSLNTFLLCLLIMYLMRLAPTDESPSDEGYLTRTIIAGCVTALLFGIHPLRVESVAWIAERKDVLSAFFMFLSLICYVNYAGRHESIRKPVLYAASLVCFVFALMSKPIALTLPFILIIFDFYPFRRFAADKKTMFLEKAPFLFLSLFVVVLTFMAQSSSGAVKPFVLSQVGVVVQGPVFYLAKMLWPVNLSPVYPYPKNFSFLSLTFIGAFILLVVITLLCIRAWRRGNPVFLAAWTFYIIALLPVSGIVRIGTQAAADRYTYIPGIAPFFLIGLGAAWFAGRPSSKAGIKSKLIIVPFIIICCLLGFLTIRQIGVWKNSIILWTTVLQYYPGYSDGYFNRANAYMMAGKYKEHIQTEDRSGTISSEAGEYQSALRDFSKAIALNPTGGAAYNNRAKIYFKTGDYQKGLQDLNNAIKLEPSSAGFYSNRCQIYNALANHAQAVKDCSRAIEIDPQDDFAYFTRGLSFSASGRQVEAMADYDKSILINPYNPKVFFSRGLAYKEKGELQKALDDFNMAVQLNPRYSDAYVNRGVVYGEMNDLQKAVEDFTLAIRINPKDSSAYYNRGAALYRMDKKEQAMQDLRQAARLGDKAIRKILKGRGVQW